MKDNKRWELAQNYEFNWWKKRKDVIGVDYYRNSAEEIRNFYSESKVLEKNTGILEIGSGATGILTFLIESEQRFAIDPLESYYSTVFSNLRDKTVKYFNAKGENLPFEDKKFDLVIIDNVLDHCENPSKVMNEAVRVLKENGSIYFRQNTYNMYGKFMRALMELFLVDKGHPFTFRKGELVSLFNLHGLKIVKYKKAGYYTTWQREITSKSLKDKIKALLFITRDKVTYYLIKV